MARRCVACKKTGHTVTTCTSSAAGLIRDLREKLKYQRIGQKRKPGRVLPKSRGQAKSEAAAKYTPVRKPEKKKLARRVLLSDRLGKGLIGFFDGDDHAALEKLQAAGYIPPKPKKCPVCNKGALSAPAVHETRALFYRCTRNQCNRRMNVLKHSIFTGLRGLTIKQLAVMIKMYTNTDKAAPPPVDDLAADCDGGRRQTREIVAKLRGVEAAVAKRQNSRGQLAGDLEVDEHGIRSFHVSTTNAAFEKYRTKKLMNKKLPYFLNYIRVVGLRQRGGGRLYLSFLPPKLLPPKSRPPPISEEELINSGILKRAKPGSCVVHTDGAQAYPSVIKRSFRKLRHQSVAHSRMEFVKPVRPVRLPSGWSASSSGTQAIDSTWKQLDKAIPAELHTKAGHVVNPLLEEYTWCWLYRVNNCMGDGFTTLGSYVRDHK